MRTPIFAPCFQAKEKQIQRIRGVFHRHLSVPLNDMNSTLLAYKSWEAEQGNDLDVNSGDLKDVSSHVANAYKKALEMRNARVHLEEQISNPDLPDSERISVFKVSKFHVTFTMLWFLSLSLSL